MRKFVRTILIALMFTTIALAQRTVISSTNLGFSIVSPTELITKTIQGKTHAGADFTAYTYDGATANGYYTLLVSVYPFQVTNEDLDRIANGTTEASGGTLQERSYLTISGQPAEHIIIVLPNGTHYIDVITFRADKAYQVMYAVTADQKVDADEARGWFSSFQTF